MHNYYNITIALQHIIMQINILREALAEWGGGISIGGRARTSQRSRCRTCAEGTMEDVIDHMRNTISHELMFALL